MGCVEECLLGTLVGIPRTHFVNVRFQILKQMAEEST